MPEGGRVRFLNAERIDGCTHYLLVYVCLYSCLILAAQVGRTTLSLPGYEFPSQRQVAIFHGRGRGCTTRGAARICCCTPYDPFTRACVLALIAWAPPCRSDAPRPADTGASSPAGGERRGLMPEVRRVQIPNAACIYGCMPHASIYVCLYSCLGPAVWACAIPQRRTHMLLYARRICLRVPVFLPEPCHAGRSRHARLTRGRVSQPAASGVLSRLSSGVSSSRTPNA